MLSSVDNIEAWDWKSLWDWVAGNFGVVLPEWNSLGSSTGLGGSKRDYKRTRKPLVYA